MKQMVDTLSIMSLSKPVHKIWQEVSSKFYPNDGCRNCLVPSEIVCDFEHALIEATQMQFENALVIDCLFHWKQAIRRRMTKRHNIPEDEVGIAMTKGVLDMLTAIDPELVPDKGIKWVKREIRMRCAATGISYPHPKWKAFWSYFRATWLEHYNSKEWNLYGVQNKLVARTNNLLERFHRELNRAFSPHPSIVTFVSTIRQISQDYVAKLADIATGRRNRGTTTNAKVRKKNSKRKGKNKQKQNKGRDIHDASSDEFEVPSPVDVQQSEGLSESESEEDAPPLEE
ncbi:Hypothetical protein PHPALM_1860 [Phytophthora palmivora]|uniref:MULE transposase domain-containing protein n=1 Tax=Phytophthora palmivora TaxID=4796 RepID=A0A2P4YR89_9STRA|nr:Hypothetical protein PHPALM_1860 [Phytophthora palmivora]